MPKMLIGPYNKEYWSKWTKVTLKQKGDINHNPHKWIQKNITKRYGVIKSNNYDVLDINNLFSANNFIDIEYDYYFEDSNEAFLFKLSWG